MEPPEEMLQQVGAFEPSDAKRVIALLEARSIPFEVEADDSALFTIADIKLSKSRLRVEELKHRAKGLLASYPRHQPEWLGLSVENTADYLPKGT